MKRLIVPPLPAASQDDDLFARLLDPVLRLQELRLQREHALYVMGFSDLRLVGIVAGFEGATDRVGVVAQGLDFDPMEIWLVRLHGALGGLARGQGGGDHDRGGRERCRRCLARMGPRGPGVAGLRRRLDLVFDSHAVAPGLASADRSHKAQLDGLFATPRRESRWLVVAGTFSRRRPRRAELSGAAKRNRACAIAFRQLTRGRAEAGAARMGSRIVVVGLGLACAAFCAGAALRRGSR